LRVGIERFGTGYRDEGIAVDLRYV